METLLKARASELKTSEARSMYYAQAWLLTHYLMTNRLKQLDAYARAVGSQGADPVAALPEATGLSLRQIEDELREYMKNRIRYERWDISTLPEPQIAVSALSPAADDLLLEQQQLRWGVSEERGQSVLGAVRTRAAKHPGDRLAQMVLARAEVELGERAAGEAILQRLLEADGGDVEALELLALSRMAAGDADPARRRELYAEARKLLIRANKVDPDRYQTLYAYARARSGEPNYPTKNDLEALARAAELAPQVRSLRMTAAQQLLEAGHHAHAASLLTPLANDPHGGILALAARALLEAAEAGLKSSGPVKGGAPAAE